MTTYKSEAVDASEALGQCLSEEDLFQWELLMDKEIQRYLAAHPESGVVPMSLRDAAREGLPNTSSV